MQELSKRLAQRFAIAAVLALSLGAAACKKAAEEKKELDRQGIQKTIVEWFADFYAGNDFNPVIQFTGYEEKPEGVTVHLVLSFPDLNEVKRELECELEHTDKGWVITKAPDL